MTTIIKNVSSASGMISRPQPVTLGSLHYPNTASATGSSGSIDLSWSTEVQGIGNDTDIAHIIVFKKSPSGEIDPYNVQFAPTAQRKDGSATITYDAAASGEDLVVLWFENSDVQAQGDENFSLAQFLED